MSEMNSSSVFLFRMDQEVTTFIDLVIVELNRQSNLLIKLGVLVEFVSDCVSVTG